MDRALIQFCLMIGVMSFGNEGHAESPAVGNLKNDIVAVIEESGSNLELATVRIQAALDSVFEAGGGRVVIPKGRHRTGSLVIRSNTTLELADGAVLEGPADWRCWTKPSLIWVQDATNVTICGKGTVFGNGRKFDPLGPRTQRSFSLCFFHNCCNVRLEGVTFRESPAWTVNIRRVDGFHGKGFKVYSHGCWENDGVDIESRNVLIENCDIDSDDDAMCLKGDNYDYTVENVEIRNCRLSSNCNFIKFGTTTVGVLRNVNIHDCALVGRNAFRPIDWRKIVPGLETDISGLAGIAVEMVDGGQLYDVRIRNITMTKCVQTPIFIRLGRRRKDGRGPTRLDHVLIENVKGDAVSQIACSITGVPAEDGEPALRPHDITIRNVDLVFPGGGTKRQAFTSPVPEHSRKYPENRMFDCQILPGYAFYVRHADGILMEDVKWRTVLPDEREPFFCDDATVKVVRSGTGGAAEEDRIASVPFGFRNRWDEAVADYDARAKTGVRLIRQAVCTGARRDVFRIEVETSAGRPLKGVYSRPRDLSDWSSFPLVVLDSRSGDVKSFLAADDHVFELSFKIGSLDELLAANRAVEWAAMQKGVDRSRILFRGEACDGGAGLCLCGLNRHFTRALIWECDLALKGFDGSDLANFARSITFPVRYLAGRAGRRRRQECDKWLMLTEPFK